MSHTHYFIFALSSAFFLSACSNTAPQIVPEPPKTVLAPAPKKPVKKATPSLPKAPKKKIELKEVQDDNYSPEYMYPEDKYKKDKLVEENTHTTSLEAETPSMSKAECIAMIGQEKFDKYTEMFGNESASIKRCTLLKSMQN